ncbi:MAG TPA: hypothetical protein VHD56_07380 [Tepidisphaeraceae bacterium]|nr:hypothetical protein [Tepidisphaeraceae bacterium]
MDLSKLPKLSETPSQVPPPQQPDSPQVAQVSSVQGGTGSQAWLSLILGIVFMMMGWSFARFMIAKLTGQPFHTGAVWQIGEKAGQEVDYFELSGYTAFTDTAIFLFGLATLLEGIILACVSRNTPGTRALVGSVLLLTAGMTLFNVVVAGLLISSGFQPIMSFLVIAFGGWMTMYEWQLLKQMQARQ